MNDRRLLESQLTVQTRSVAGPGRQLLSRAQRRLPATFLDRDALERFFERAVRLVPLGDVTPELAVGGEHAGTFPTVRDLAADPDLPARLSDCSLSVMRRERGVPTHDVRLRGDDGRATLSAEGDELWAHATVDILADVLAVYGKTQTASQLAPLSTINYFSAGVTLAVALAAGHYRGVPAAVASAMTCGAVWFLLDMVLSEIRLALTPRPPPALTIEIRSQRASKDGFAANARLWFGLRIAVAFVWIAVVSFVFAIVVPHVPKVW